MPALLTSTSSPPRSSSASSNHASISPSLATSTWVAAMSALSARNPSSAASSISQTCTLAPSLAKARAIDRPIPEAAAVIMTRLTIPYAPPMTGIFSRLDLLQRALRFHFHDPAELCRLREFLVRRPDGRERLVEIAPHRDDLARPLVDMQLHDFIRRDQLLCFAVEHAMEEMHALFVASDELRLDDEGLARFHLAVV